MTTAADHPQLWSWPFGELEMVVWAAYGAGWDIGDPLLVLAQWDGADPRTVLEALASEMAQQPAGVLLAGAWAGLAKYATQNRDEAVRDVVAVGVSLRQVGIGIGMSHQGIAKILGR